MKKRKPTIKEDWADFRVFLYGFMRMIQVSTTFLKTNAEFEEKFPTTDDKNVYGGVMKSISNKKGYVHILNVKTDEYLEIKLEGVKKTIKRCLNMDIYWRKRKHFLKNKNTPKKGDVRAYSDEAQEYFRSITSNIKNEKYDNVFYSNNKNYEEILTALNIKEKDERELIKKLFLSPARWTWYKEIR